MAAANRGRGKELPRDEAGQPTPAVPRNRRERRAQQAWRRKHGLDERGRRRPAERAPQETAAAEHSTGRLARRWVAGLRARLESERGES